MRMRLCLEAERAGWNSLEKSIVKGVMM
jgi:hypothetical protein